jgi:hypothetical protein
MNPAPQVVVRASLPRFCKVCQGGRWVDADVQVDMVPRLIHAGELPCPHCTPGDGPLLGLPIADWPIRVDRPRGGAA